MPICFCMLVSICVSVFMYLYVYLCVCLCLYVYMLVYVCVCMCVYISVYICVYVCVYLCVCLPVAMCLCTCLYLPVLCMSVSLCLEHSVPAHGPTAQISSNISPNSTESSCAEPFLTPSLSSLGDHTAQVLSLAAGTLCSNMSSIFHLLTVTAQPGCAWVIPGSRCGSRATLQLWEEKL